MTEFIEPDRPPREAGCPVPRLLDATVTVLLAALLGVPAMLPVFRDDLQWHFGIANAQYGLLLNVGNLAGIAGAVAGGWLVDRMGARRVLRWCLAGCVLGLGLGACPGPWILLLVALGVTGLFWTPLMIAVQAHLVGLFPSDRRRVITLNLVAQAGCGVFYSLLAEWLVALTRAGSGPSFGYSLHGPFAVMMLVALWGAVWTRRMIPRAPSAAEPVRAPLTAVPVLGFSSLCLALLAVIHSAADVAILYWIPKVLGGASFDRQFVLPGVAVAGYSVAYLVSRVGLGLLPEQWGRRWMLIVPGLLGGALFLLGLASRSQLWAAIGYVAGGFCWSLEYPAILACLAHHERRFGSALGLLSVLSGLAMFALATSLGVWADHLPAEQVWRILLVPAMGFPLVGVGGAFWVWRFGRSVPVEPPIPPVVPPGRT